MISTHDVLRKRLLEAAGVFEQRLLPPLSQLRDSEWSTKFEKLMRNRMLMGAFRYEEMKDKGNFHYRTLEVLRYKLELYIETGNDECLVDIANYAMIEFVHGKHPKKHFSAADDTRHNQRTVK